MPEKYRFTLVLLTTWLFTVAFAQLGEPPEQRFYLLGELSGVPVQADLRLLPATDSPGSLEGQLFYETRGGVVQLSGNVDQRNNLTVQLENDLGEAVGSISGTLTERALEGTYTPALGADITPVNWRIVADYVTLSVNQNRIETTTSLPHFRESASLLSSLWQERAFADNLEFVREGQRDVLEYDLFSYWLEDTYHITYYAEDFVSVLQVISVYAGGAHPNLYYDAHNVGIGQDIAELTLRDVLTKRGLMVLSDYVLEQLSEEGAEFVVSGSVSQLSEADMSAFVVSPQGLHLHFAPYAVGPYVQGTFEVVVPWPVLADYMQPENPLVRFL